MAGKTPRCLRDGDGLARHEGRRDQRAAGGRKAAAHVVMSTAVRRVRVSRWVGQAENSGNRVEVP
jgi:hypothetical protein